MKITIIGPGAIGLLLASSLEKHNDVSVLVKEKHYDVLIERGLWIKNGNKKKRIKANIVTEIKDSEIAIIAVKGYDLESIKKILSNFKGKIIICQNGLKMLEYNSDNDNDVFSIVTSVGAVSLELGISEYMGAGTTVIGNLNNEDKRTFNIDKLFSEDYFEIFPVENIIEYIWLKAIINSAINPIASLAEVKNGKLRNPELNEKVREICEESESIAQKKGIKLPLNPWKEINSIIEKTSENKCSMLQDLENGQKTEIDSINGELIKIARELSIIPVENQQVFSEIKKISVNT